MSQQFHLYTDVFISIIHNSQKVVSQMFSSGWMDNQNITECASENTIKKARILEWVVISFSRGSSRLMDWTHVFCLAGVFFTTEPLEKPESHDNFTLVLWGTAGSFSKASALFYVPISSWLQWLHILVNICWLFDSSHPNWYEAVSHFNWIVFFFFNWIVLRGLYSRYKSLFK